jgi:hypothetical protein
MKIKLTQEEARLCYMMLQGVYADMELWAQDQDEVDEARQQELEMLDSVLYRLAEIANIAR